MKNPNPDDDDCLASLADRVAQLEKQLVAIHGVILALANAQEAATGAGAGHLAGPDRTNALLAAPIVAPPRFAGKPG